MKLSSAHRGGDRQRASCLCVCVCVCSVHPFAAVDGSAVTRDLMLIVLQVELVVVAQLEGEGQ